MTAPKSTPALELRDLSVAYRTGGVELPVLRGVSFAIAPGETYGLVGESGCGKSTAAFAALRALARNGAISGGRVLVDGQDITNLDPAGLRQLRLSKVSMVYQDPGRALNPSMTVGRQIAEVYEAAGTRRADALARAEAMLAKVRIPGTGRVMTAFPHQLSGGMQQRVVIAMALAKNPTLLVLDEPTTGLDATVEAEVLDLIVALKGEFATSVLFISHNLAIIERMCDRIGVLYAGSLVEEGPGAELLSRPLHPYTMRLLRCLPAAGRRKSDGRLDTIPGFLPPLGSIQTGCVFAPRCDFADAVCRTVAPPPVRIGGQTARCHHIDLATTLRRAGPEAAVPAPPTVSSDARPALQVDGVSKTFRVGPHALRAVSDVSLTLLTGETLGLVGESGSGKTTLARLLLGLTAPDAGGTIELDGQKVAGQAKRRSRADQKALQIVFQNPDSALNRSHTVRHLIERSLSRLAGLFGHKRAERLAALVSAVRLTDRHLPMRPRQLSGGLKQRVAIARAFAGDPRVVICDEPTSALDVSVQAAILNLLAELQGGAGVSYVFISHDLGVVRYLSDRIAVLYLGRIMEIGPAEDVFNGPHHPYTEALLSAVPDLADRHRGDKRIRLSGEMPSPLAPPPGCVFNSRCPRKMGAICETEEPTMHTDTGHAIRCHLPQDALGRRGGPPPPERAASRSHAAVPA